MWKKYDPVTTEAPNSDAEFDELATSLGFHITFSVDNSQGDRESMEDFYRISYQKTEDGKGLKYLYLAIFDGHSGPEAAKFAKEHLLKLIVGLPYFWSPKDIDVLRAIRDGFLRLQSEMSMARSSWPTQNGFRCRAGTTASVLFVHNKKVYIAHVGDSSLVMGYYDTTKLRWLSKRLTVDHTPDKPSEKTRIERGGGKVIVYDGVPRILFKRESLISVNNVTRRAIVETPLIAVARALGDLWSYSRLSKEYIVSPVPDLTIEEVNKYTDSFIIMGSDGLWNRINSVGAVNVVQNTVKSGHKSLSSKVLLRQIYQPWVDIESHADNITIITLVIETLEPR
ncbi:protein phosphatase 1D-like [Teleopsis dalmanni]|uniref:protein phosphatase 1D-like n=1 Tax=Teleopsis dalmanni TaxID=139649 RepID=UPI0018CF8E1A|nr:protein phosphatase 1D-like [Teleopsis dalmanni]